MGTIASRRLINYPGDIYVESLTVTLIDREILFDTALMGSPENDRVNFNIDWNLNGAGMLDFNKRGHGIWRNNNALNMDTNVKTINNNKLFNKIINSSISLSRKSIKLK